MKPENFSPTPLLSSRVCLSSPDAHIVDRTFGALTGSAMKAISKNTSKNIYKNFQQLSLSLSISVCVKGNLRINLIYIFP